MEDLKFATEYNCNWIVFQSEYLKIISETRANRKTYIYHIWSNKGECDIGEIKWYGAWKKYCFFPYENTIWDNKCLNEIISFLNETNKKEV